MGRRLRQLYGTSCAQVERERAAGHDIILEIDVQGAASIRQDADAVSIFILPPSFECCANDWWRAARIRRQIWRAIARTRRRKLSNTSFQYVILNDDINRASQQLASVIYAERARRERQEVNLRSALEDFGVQ